MTSNQMGLFDTPSGPATRAEIEHAYHNTGRPLLSDDAYNALPPAETVGAPPPENTKKGTHAFPMLSLDKIHRKEQIISYLKTTVADLGYTHIPALAIGLKIDGLSCSITYAPTGKLNRSLTRGDGEKGEDITASVSRLPSVPDRIPATGNVVTINGELSLSRRRFDAINEQMILQQITPYSSPRNAASGIIRASNAERGRESGMEFLAFNLPDARNWTGNYDETMRTLQSWNFTTVTEFDHLYLPECATAEEAADQIWDIFDHILTRRATLDHDIDGIVISFANADDRARLGIKSNTPRWAISVKPPAEHKPTRLLGIRVQVGSTGTLTPVADLEPVTIAGITITSANLHNEDTIAKLDIRIGDIVLVERANDVIPNIVRREGEHTPDSRPFVFPTVCPACGAPTSRDSTNEAAHYCSASMTCTGTRKARFIRLADRTIFNIEGLGDKNIGHLCSLDILKTPADLFTLPETIKTVADQIKGWGPGKQQNLESAVAASRTVPLERFFASLLIRMIGRTASKQLADHYRTLERFLADIPHITSRDTQTIASIQTLSEFGNVLTENLISWLSNPQNIQSMESLLKQIAVENLPEAITGKLTGEIVVFTGKLATGSRDELREQAEQIGAKTSDSLTKNTTILVYGDKAGSKLQKANSYIAQNIPIRIMTEEEWTIFIS